MVGIYFSGTGNTKHCVQNFLQGLECCAEMYPIEKPHTADAVKVAEDIVFGYPVYYSNLPKIVRDFITENAGLWQGKRIFIISTMAMFSGDGAGCAARLFKKYGAKVLGGLHLKMPDSIGDVKMLKKPAAKNRAVIEKADKKIQNAVSKVRLGKYPKNGLGMFGRLAGFLGQRLYFNGKTKKYFDKVKADVKKCVGCSLCVSVCPMQNVRIEDGKAKFSAKCTMCYRCFSQCPTQAITLIGNNVYQQNRYENFSDGV